MKRIAQRHQMDDEREPEDRVREAVPQKRPLETVFRSLAWESQPAIDLPAIDPPANYLPANGLLPHTLLAYVAWGPGASSGPKCRGPGQVH